MTRSMHDLAGLQKTSLIDYPGRLSCVVFITGCNFRCPYCHNPSLALGRYPDRIRADEFLEFVAQRRDFLEGVVISGGEPTLSDDLPELCVRLRASGLPIKLDTNGSRPDRLAHLLRDGLIDYVAMDIKTDPESYGPPLCVAGAGALVLQSIALIMESGIDYEFRTTCARPFVDEATIARIAGTIKGARRYILQAFRAGTTLSADMSDQQAHGFGPDLMRAFQCLAAPHVLECRLR